MVTLSPGGTPPSHGTKENACSSGVRSDPAKGVAKGRYRTRRQFHALRIEMMDAPTGAPTKRRWYEQCNNAVKIDDVTSTDMDLCDLSLQRDRCVMYVIRDNAHLCLSNSASLLRSIHAVSPPKPSQEIDGVDGEEITRGGLRRPTHSTHQLAPQDD